MKDVVPGEKSQNLIFNCEILSTSYFQLKKKKRLADSSQLFEIKSMTNLTLEFKLDKSLATPELKS